MARYRKKPVVIEAIQWDGRNFEEISNFVGSALDYYINDCAWRAGAGQPVRHLTIKTLEGDMNVNIGDYIIKGVRGEFYPCKPDIFKETYESADAADVAPKSEVEKIFEKLKRRECSNSVCAWCIHANAYGRRNEECDKPYIDKNGKEQKACYVYAKFESLIDNELAELKKKYTEIENGT